MGRDEVEAKLAALRAEHGALDREIATLMAETGGDQLQIARLKRRKLRLKDEIAVLHDRLVPDIIA